MATPISTWASPEGLNHLTLDNFRNSHACTNAEDHLSARWKMLPALKESIGIPWLEFHGHLHIVHHNSHNVMKKAKVLRELLRDLSKVLSIPLEGLAWSGGSTVRPSSIFTMWKNTGHPLPGTGNAAQWRHTNPGPQIQPGQKLPIQRVKGRTSVWYPGYPMFQSPWRERAVSPLFQIVLGLLGENWKIPGHILECMRCPTHPAACKDARYCEGAIWGDALCSRQYTELHSSGEASKWNGSCGMLAGNHH